jgi:hypothetical protein
VLNWYQGCRSLLYFNHKLCGVAIKTHKTEPVNLNQNFSRIDQHFLGNFDYFLIAITWFPVSTCIYALCISAIDDHTLCVLVQGQILRSNYSKSLIPAKTLLNVKTAIKITLKAQT